MDFVSDALFDGRRLRALTVVDAFTREALAIEVDQGIKGEQVVARLALFRKSATYTRTPNRAWMAREARRTPAPSAQESHPSETTKPANALAGCCQAFGAQERTRTFTSRETGT